MIEPIQKDADHRKWNEYPGVQLTTNAVQTYTEEETPDYWYIWVQPGINATVKVYPNGAGASGRIGSSSSPFDQPPQKPGAGGMSKPSCRRTPSG